MILKKYSEQKYFVLNLKTKYNKIDPLIWILLFLNLEQKNVHYLISPYQFAHWSHKSQIAKSFGGPPRDCSLTQSDGPTRASPSERSRGKKEKQTARHTLPHLPLKLSLTLSLSLSLSPTRHTPLAQKSFSRSRGVATLWKTGWIICNYPITK